MDLKVEFLNEAIAMTRTLAMKRAEGVSTSLTLRQVYKMVESLGAPVNGYRTIAEKTAQHKINNENEAPKYTHKDIGFLPDDGKSDTDLKPGFHRSIGFGPATVEAYPGPEKRTDPIQIWPYADKATGLPMVRILNGYDKQVRNVPLPVLKLPGGNDGEKKFVIGFDSSEFEWILRYGNLANPTGDLGFTVNEEGHVKHEKLSEAHPQPNLEPAMASSVHMGFEVPDGGPSVSKLPRKNPSADVPRMGE